MLMLYVPGVTEPLAFKVRVEFPVELKLVGLRAPVRPEGSP